MARLYCLMIGYVFGLFQTGYLVGKGRGVDLKHEGSGNSGTTNALRVMGKKAGAIVFAGDLIKLWLACLLTQKLFGNGSMHDAQGLILMLYTAFGVVLGHNFPFYLHFKGGKGIAVTAALIVLIDWRLLLAEILVFVLTVVLSRYVSLGSIFVVIVLNIGWIVLAEAGILAIHGAAYMESVILLILWAVLAIIRHRENIKRLLAGTENRLF